MASVPYQDLLRSVALCGHGSLLGRSLDGRLYVVPMLCKSWQCERCRPAKRMQWQDLIAAGNPNRHLVLTIRPSDFSSPEAALAAMLDAWPKFLARIRRAYGPTAYVRVVELTKNGFPHFHVLLRSAFLPRARLIKWWTSYGLGSYLWINPVAAGSHHARYITKYLHKGFGSLCARFPKKRMISKSPNWLSLDAKAALLSHSHASVVEWRAFPKAGYTSVVAALCQNGCFIIDASKSGLRVKLSITGFRSVNGILDALCADDFDLIEYCSGRDPPGGTSLVGFAGVTRRLEQDTLKTRRTPSTIQQEFPFALAHAGQG